MNNVTRKDIEEFINSLSPEHQERARQFQWRIDQQLNCCKGIQRYNKMVELFWEGVDRFQKTLENPSSMLSKQKPDNVIRLIK